MSKVKRVSILSLMLAMALFFTGCANGELKLYNAFLKSQEITSMESETNIKLTVSGEGLTEESEAILNELGDVLNNLNMKINQKSQSNAEGTVAKAQADLILDMGGVKTDMSVWVDANVSKDEFKMDQIIKMPQMLMAMAGEEYANKEYIVYDYEEILAMSGGETDFSELIDWSMEIEPKITEFVKSYGENFDPGFKMVESKGQKVVDKEILNVYELRLNDKQFKDLIRYAGNDLVENKDIAKLMKEYMDMVVKISGGQNEEMKEELSKEIEELKAELPNIMESFNKFMDEMEDIKILDEKGLVIEYGVNKDGYVVSEKGEINLMLDLEDMINEINKLETEELEIAPMESIIKLKLEFDSNISNINKDIKIEMPELNDENTLKFSEMMNLEL